MKGATGGLDPTLLDMLEELERLCAFELEITSGYRKGDPKAHGRGVAVDIRCHESHRRYVLVESAMSCGFTRVGVYDRHVHLDIGETVSPKFPSYVLWTGVSK